MDISNLTRPMSAIELFQNKTLFSIYIDLLCFGAIAYGDVSNSLS